MVPCFIRIHFDLFSIYINKGTSTADFLADHPSLEIEVEQIVELEIYGEEKEHWILKFDGSSIENLAGVGIVIISPTTVKTTLSFNMTFECTNNQAEYEAFVIGLEILLEFGAKDVQFIEESQLVLCQLIGEYKSNNLLLAPYFTAAIQLLDSFDKVEFEHVPRESNWKADELAQIPLSVKNG